jgi:hypothetical protein
MDHFLSLDAVKWIWDGAMKAKERALIESSGRRQRFGAVIAPPPTENQCLRMRTSPAAHPATYEGLQICSARGARCYG